MQPDLDENIVKEILKIQKESNHSFGAKNYMVKHGIDESWHDAYFNAAELYMEQNSKKSLPLFVAIGVVLNAIIIYYTYTVFGDSQEGNPYFSEIKLAINSWVMQLSPVLSIIIGLLAATGQKNKTLYKVRLVKVALISMAILNFLFLFYIYSQVY